MQRAPTYKKINGRSTNKYPRPQLLGKYSEKNTSKSSKKYHYYYFNIVRIFFFLNYNLVRIWLLYIWFARGTSGGIPGIVQVVTIAVQYERKLSVTKYYLIEQHHHRRLLLTFWGVPQWSKL